MSFCSFIKGISPKICRWCFILINSVLSNLLGVCILSCLCRYKTYCHLSINKRERQTHGVTSYGSGRMKDFVNRYLGFVCLYQLVSSSTSCQFWSKCLLNRELILKPGQLQFPVCIKRSFSFVRLTETSYGLFGTGEGGNGGIG